MFTASLSIDSCGQRELLLQHKNMCGIITLASPCFVFFFDREMRVVHEPTNFTILLSPSENLWGKYCAVFQNLWLVTVM